MGDRGNIVIRECWPNDLHSREAVFLYSHWGGSELPSVLHRAIRECQGRLNDPPYFARIVFDRMIADAQGESTSFGISTRLTDNEYDLLVVRDGDIYLLAESEYEQHGFDRLAHAPQISADAYLTLPENVTWEQLAAAARGIPA